MNVLVFGAHPDDIELGCAGTLLKYIQQKHKIFMCIMTQGELSGDPKTRIEEQEKASEKLGATELIWGNFKDGGIEVNQQTIRFVEDLIGRIKPEEILVNYGVDTHQDHRALYEIVFAASRHVKKVLCYEDYTSYTFTPTIFVDIEDVLQDKLKIIKTFRSQLQKEQKTEHDMIEGVKAIANFRGFQSRTKYAEGFTAVRFLKA